MSSDMYYIAFRLRLNTANGKRLANILDVADNRLHIRPYPSKRKMMEFVEEFKDGFDTVHMLKPIS